ncbi:MAG: hypothetical protein HYW48_08085 [Deltaproteobacteria bacterium]|nr:hypothetical protein [Deltaproteobacteria bacterium]
MDYFYQLMGVADVQDLDLSSPQSWTFVIMLTVALIYGVMLHQLYNVYYRENEPVDASLSRSLILLTPALMTIFWVIQFSLPLSVGLLGTLSFVRFRSPVKRAEDVAFIVIALACSVSTAIVKPLIGAGLILIFLIYSLTRNFFRPASLSGKNFAVLTFNTKMDTRLTDLESEIRKARCRSFEFVSSRTYDGITSFVFNIANLRQVHLSDLTHRLEEMDKGSSINVFYPNGRLGS